MNSLLTRIAVCAAVVFQFSSCSDSSPLRDDGGLPDGHRASPQTAGLGGGQTNTTYAIESRRDKSQKELSRSYRAEALKASDPALRERYLQIAEQIDDELASQVRR
jgi:hypothetical protein